jgi:MFS family permease
VAREQGQQPRALKNTMVAAVAVGTLLNPLNSSMIAVALVSLSAGFEVSLATATWLVSAFYLGGAIGYPLMGQLADRFGPRRVFNVGLILVAVTSALAPFSPALLLLIAIRFLQSIGSSSAYPAGVAIFRAQDARKRAPAGALGAVSITNSVSSALGPVLGGALVALAGWPAIFVANVPVALLGIALALLWLPPDHAGPADGVGSGPLRLLTGSNAATSEEATGEATEEATIARGQPSRTAAPRPSALKLLRSPALLAVYAQFAAVNIVFYAVFYGLPLWLEQTRGYAPEVTGLLILPVAGIGVLATPLAARLIGRAGPRPSLLIGSVLLVVGSLLLLHFDDATGLPELLVVGGVLGVPNGFNNLGLQAALYEAAASDQIGAAAGFLQTCRYVGAIVSTAVIGVIFGAAASSNSLHALALVMAVVSAALVIASLATHRPS